MGCDVKNCRQESSFGFYGRSICEGHWALHCDDNSKFDLKKLWNINDQPKVSRVIENNWPDDNDDEIIAETPREKTKEELKKEKRRARRKARRNK